MQRQPLGTSLHDRAQSGSMNEERNTYYQMSGHLLRRKQLKAEADRLVQQGIQQCKASQFEAALQSWQRALKIYQDIGDRQGEANSLLNLGNAYAQLGQYERAIEEYYQPSLTIARDIGYRIGEVYSLSGLGIACTHLGQHDEAIKHHQESLEIAKAIGNHQGESNALGNLGNIYQSLGQYYMAIEQHQQSLVMARRIGDLRGEAYSLSSLGVAFDSLGKYQMAIEHNQQALKILRDIGDRFGEGQALHNLAHAFFENGQLAESENKLRTAIEVWESIRADLGGNAANKVSILEVQARTYNLLQQVLIVQNQPNTALEIAERGRARALVELFATRLSSQLARQSPIKSPTIQQIQQIAQEQNSTLVEYSIIDLGNLLLIWVIKPNGEIAFRSLDLKPLWQQENTSVSDLVLQARKSFGIEETQGDTTVAASIENSLPIRHISQTLRELHQLLIEPIADLLPSDLNTPVIFIPQGNIFLVPFPALQDAIGKFLIEQHTILTAPSIQALELTRQQRQRVETIHELPLESQDVLVVGNPTMPTIPLRKPLEPLPPLPGSEAEANVIASLLNTQALIGDKAKKVDIMQQMPKARLIHLATHGLLDDINQLGVPGAIALAPSDNDNGFLTSGEILELKLNAELVVLSGCRTGQGKITGDGVIGLSCCLFVAGVPSVIVSLWEVQDESTQLLMTEFYRNLLQHQLNKAQALRQAMLTTMEEYPDTLSWAAFTLVGESE